jgi:hypothetical protein
MIDIDFQLGNEILRTTQSTILWRNEKGVVEIAEDVPVVTISFDGKQCGYVFRGRGRLRVDTIAETAQGAVGKPVDKEISEPFLMLGDPEGIQDSLKPADDEDLVRLKIEGTQDFLTAAEELLDKFLQSSSNRHRRRFNNERGSFIFAFQNERGRLDLLVGKGTKLVYTAADKVFVSKGNKVVLTSDGEVVISRPGKSVVVSKGSCPDIHIHKH